MTNQEWLRSLTKEELAAIFTSGNVQKLNRRAREVWLSSRHVKEDEIFIFEKRKRKENAI